VVFDEPTGAIVSQPLPVPFVRVTVYSVPIGPVVGLTLRVGSAWTTVNGALVAPRVKPPSE
jgi:hypothetical protein